MFQFYISYNFVCAYSNLHFFFCQFSVSWAVFTDVVEIKFNWFLNLTVQNIRHFQKRNESFVYKICTKSRELGNCMLANFITVIISICSWVLESLFFIEYFDNKHGWFFKNCSCTRKNNTACRNRSESMSLATFDEIAFKWPPCRLFSPLFQVKKQSEWLTDSRKKEGISSSFSVLWKKCGKWETLNRKRGKRSWNLFFLYSCCVSRDISITVFYMGEKFKYKSVKSRASKNRWENLTLEKIGWTLIINI